MNIHITGYNTYRLGASDELAESPLSVSDLLGQALTKQSAADRLTSPK